MADQFANQCSTTIATGGYVAGSGVLNVVSTSAPWPQTGTFTVQLQNSVLTLLRVTAVNSGTQWAVTVEANDMNSAVGTMVIGTVLSAAAMSLMQPQITLLPLVAPVISTFTWDNQGSATATQFNNYATMYIPGSAVDNIRSLLIPVTPPYTAIMGFAPTMRIGASTNDSYAGITLKSSDGLYSIFCVTDFLMYGAFNYSAAGTFASSYQFTSETCGMYGGMKWLKIVNDGSSYRTFYISSDGISWISLAQVSYTNYLTESYIGMGLDASRGTTYPVAMTVFHWKVTNP